MIKLTKVTVSEVAVGNPPKPDEQRPERPRPQTIVDSVSIFKKRKKKRHGRRNDPDEYIQYSSPKKKNVMEEETVYMRASNILRVQSTTHHNYNKKMQQNVVNSLVFHNSDDLGLVMPITVKESPEEITKMMEKEEANAVQT